MKALKMPTSIPEISNCLRAILLSTTIEDPSFPFDDSAEKVGEDLRLTYRYLDLRRESNPNSLFAIVHPAIRKYFDDQNFLEIETPMLFKSTPEGAREFWLQPSKRRKILRPTHLRSSINKCSWLRNQALLPARPLLP